MFLLIVINHGLNACRCLMPFSWVFTTWACPVWDDSALEELLHPSQSIVSPTLCVFCISFFPSTVSKTGSCPVPLTLTLLLLLLLISFFTITVPNKLFVINYLFQFVIAGSWRQQRAKACMSFIDCFKSIASETVQLLLWWLLQSRVVVMIWRHLATCFCISFAAACHGKDSRLTHSRSDIRKLATPNVQHKLKFCARTCLVGFIFALGAWYLG